MSAEATIAVDRHLAPLLQRVVHGKPLAPGEFSTLDTLAATDPVQSAFTPAPEPGDLTFERIRLLPLVWEPLRRWWDGYFAGAGRREAALTDLWRLYLPFAQWIVREKRRRRPGELFMIGFNGSPGSGKTVLSGAMSVVLNELLEVSEGRALAASGDDWYLSRAEREPLRALGYHPGPLGVSNRSGPGTHDLDWLKRNLRELEHSGPGSVVRLPTFDKKADDRPAGPAGYVEVHGKVGVFLFDLWFAGARTDVDALALPDGLRRRVAERLWDWGPVFERMDGLWSFAWPTFDQMLAERETQELLAQHRCGSRGMSPEDIRVFMDYMIHRTWDWRITSPVPAQESISFRAWRAADHRVITVRRGDRAS
jgi:pantothenate kinase-related protein Tda10